MPADGELLEVRLLEDNDDTSGFSSGEEALDDFFWNFARSAQKAGGPRTYVAMDGTGDIVGYYSLVSSSVERAEAPERLAAGMGAYPIPTTLLARLAVDEAHQGRGIGGDLLLHALIMASRAAESVGARAIEVDALRESLTTFYGKWGFQPLDPEHHPLRMYLLMKDVRRTLRREGLLH